MTVKDRRAELNSDIKHYRPEWDKIPDDELDTALFDTAQCGTTLDVAAFATYIHLYRETS